MTESARTSGAEGSFCPQAAPPAAAPANTRAHKTACIIARIAVGIVFIVNVQCALSFVVQPSAFAPQFELTGIPGNVAVSGLGIAFLMWNATYPAVIALPDRFRSLFVVVLVQQAIGLIGESIIRAGLPAGHELLAASIERFIAFDLFGLVIMGASFVALTLTKKQGHRC